MSVRFWQRRLRQLPKLVTNKTYRAVAWRRFLLSLLNRCLPQVSFIGLSCNDVSILYHAKDRAITLYALVDGHFHASELAKIIELLEEKKCLLGKVFLEIGANVGSTTVSALKSGKFAKAIAFEPVKQNYRLIKANLALCDLEKSAVVENLAISDRSGSSKMIVSDNNFGDNRIVSHQVGKQPGFFNEQTWKSNVVGMISLDEYFDQNELNAQDISLLWVDAQGHEGHILKGASALLSKRAFPAVIEFWPHSLKEAGGLELLLSEIRAYFATVYDLKSGKQVEDIASLVDSYQGESFTDLLLIP